MTGAVVDWDHVVGIPVPALDSGLLPSSACKIITNIERAASKTTQLWVVSAVILLPGVTRGSASASIRLATAMMNSHSSSIQAVLDTSGGGG
jgi:hypothetical protein